MLRQIASVAEMPCTVLQDHTGLAKSTVSYHIKILHEAGLISVRRQGRNFFYIADREEIRSRLPGSTAPDGQPASFRSMASPCPPPPQIAATPYSTDRRRISRLRLPIIRKPDAPSG